jgi:hypothetical protein
MPGVALALDDPVRGEGLQVAEGRRFAQPCGARDLRLVERRSRIECLEHRHGALDGDNAVARRWMFHGVNGTLTRADVTPRTELSQSALPADDERPSRQFGVRDAATR